MPGVLIDTSFLITLADKSRKNSATARRYWKYFVDQEIPIFLSTIVVSEFCIKQEIDPAILRCCITLPFNWDHALLAAKFDWTRLRPSGVERAALKDDIKIIAQAAVAEMQYVITDDTESFSRYCEVLKAHGEVDFKTIKLEDGFDSAFFDPNGQRDFTDTVDIADEE